MREDGATIVIAMSGCRCPVPIRGISAFCLAGRNVLAGRGVGRVIVTRRDGEVSSEDIVVEKSERRQKCQSTATRWVLQTLLTRKVPSGCLSVTHRWLAGKRGSFLGKLKRGKRCQRQQSLVPVSETNRD